MFFQKAQFEDSVELLLNRLDEYCQLVDLVGYIDVDTATCTSDVIRSGLGEKKLVCSNFSKIFTQELMYMLRGCDSLLTRSGGGCWS